MSRSKRPVHLEEHHGGVLVTSCAYWPGSTQPPGKRTTDADKVTCSDCLKAFDGWMGGPDGQFRCRCCRRFMQDGHASDSIGWCSFTRVPVPWTWMRSPREGGPPEGLARAWWRAALASRRAA